MTAKNNQILYIKIREKVIPITADSVWYIRNRTGEGVELCINGQPQLIEGSRGQFSKIKNEFSKKADIYELRTLCIQKRYIPNISFGILSRFFDIMTDADKSKVINMTIRKKSVPMSAFLLQSIIKPKGMRIPRVRIEDPRVCRLLDIVNNKSIVAKYLDENMPPTKEVLISFVASDAFQQIYNICIKYSGFNTSFVLSGLHKQTTSELCERSIRLFVKDDFVQLAKDPDDYFNYYGNSFFDRVFQFNYRLSSKLIPCKNICRCIVPIITELLRKGEIPADQVALVYKTGHNDYIKKQCWYYLTDTRQKLSDLILHGGVPSTVTDEYLGIMCDKELILELQDVYIKDCGKIRASRYNRERVLELLLKNGQIWDLKKCYILFEDYISAGLKNRLLKEMLSRSYLERDVRSLYNNGYIKEPENRKMVEDYIFSQSASGDVDRLLQEFQRGS